ncbi:MAG: glycoside hydrolase family 55 protein [Phycisphaeraceae bacterium]
MTSPLNLALSVTLAWLVWPAAVQARQMPFPEDAGVVDVTQAPYHAVPDDDGDDTAAIQRALDDHPSGNAIIYLPKGTYRVSDTLRWPEGEHYGVYMKRTFLQGESREETVLQLVDEAEGFQDADSPRAMIYTGEAPAQRFRNGIRNLTVDTGSGNPGAIGAQYIANNQGMVRDLTIRSGDGQGVIGLDLGYTNEQGPCLITHVTVEGFDIGVRNAHIVDSVTMEHITLEGQNVVGMDNEDQVVTIRGLTSRNSVPAIRNRGAGVLTLVEAELIGMDGASDHAAIENTAGGTLFARDITAEGYGRAIANDAGHGESPDGTEIEEFVSHPVHTLFPDTPTHSLRLPIEETPEVEWGPLDGWASPAHFGGEPGDDFDNTEAMQQAIDSGAHTLYLPNGHWRFDGEVLVRGNIRRVIGCEAKLAGEGTLRVVDGDTPVVRVERLDLLYQHVSIEHASDRTLVVSGITMGEGDFITRPGAGKLFLEDVCGGPWQFENQQVWARQLNPESPTTKITNAGGDLWILGLKTERNGTLVHTTDGGRSEVLGCFAYANTGDEKVPMFITEDGALSVTMGEMVIRNQPFRTLVVETRGDETRTLMMDDTPGRGGGSTIPLYVGVAGGQ